MNILELTLDSNPVVDLIYEPYPYTTTVRLRLRVFQSPAPLMFPGEAPETLYIPHVETSEDAVSGSPPAAYVKIETRLNPDLAGTISWFPTMTVANLSGVPAGSVRHRLFTEPDPPAPNLIENHDVIDYRGGIRHVRFDITAGTVSFSCFWKKIVSGVDTTGPRNFFLQV